MDQVRNFLLAAVLLSSCTSYDSYRVLDFPDDRATHALEGWQAQGLPAGTCMSEVGQLTMIVVPKSMIETDDYCGSENKGSNVLGCFYYDGSQPTIVMRSQMYTDPEKPLEHELRHWMAMCSGYDPSGDPEHDDTRIWYSGELQDGWNYGLEASGRVTR
jgi:hypothetical protein